MLARYPRKLVTVFMTGALSLSLAGCSAFGSGDLAAIGPAGFGATPGGVKDLTSARELIKNGHVPPPEAFLVEAMYSEHDLPLSGPPCTSALCLQGAPGIAPTADGQPAGWVQLGMSSNINPTTYQRPSLTAVLCVDVSGSMGWEHKTELGTTYPTAGRLSYLLLKQLAAQLGPQDQVALVTYGDSAQTPVGLTSGDTLALLPAIEALTTKGSTNMEAGLRQAYAVAHSAGHTTSEVRVFLFTDENPNVGATGPTEFTRIVSDGAAEGTSLTVFGMGLGVRPDLMNAMAHLRGANGYTLTEEPGVPKLMAESWPWMASPLAYDLKVAVTPAPGFQVAGSYGFPGPEGSTTPQLDVSTVFLSKNRGALLLQLAPGAGIKATDLQMDGALSYTRPDGTKVSDHLTVNAAGAVLDARGTYYAQKSVGESVALALLVTGMKQAATIYAADHAQAILVMQRTLGRFTDDAKDLADPTLDVEVQLAQDLLALMEKNAPQGHLYGQ